WHVAWLFAFDKSYGDAIKPLLSAAALFGKQLRADDPRSILATIEKTERSKISESAQSWADELNEKEADLLSFFHDRLKVYLRDQGARHDLIDAVITPASDDLLDITRRVEALGAFLD